MSDFVFYSPRLDMIVPCKLETDWVRKIDNRFYIKCKFDLAKLATFSLSRDVVYRYTDEIIHISEVYPYNTQAEKDYVTEVIPDKVSTNHRDDELYKYNKIIEAICPSTISYTTFIYFAEFISYFLLFNVCDVQDRIFVQSLSMVIMTEQPTEVRVPLMVSMIKQIFSGVNLSDSVFDKLVNGTSMDKAFKIYNIREYSEFFYIPFPIIINVENLKYNCEFIII